MSIVVFVNACIKLLHNFVHPANKPSNNIRGSLFRLINAFNFYFINNVRMINLLFFVRTPLSCYFGYNKCCFGSCVGCRNCCFCCEEECIEEEERYHVLYLDFEILCVMY